MCFKCADAKEPEIVENVAEGSILAHVAGPSAVETTDFDQMDERSRLAADLSAGEATEFALPWSYLGRGHDIIALRTSP